MSVASTTAVLSPTTRALGLAGAAWGVIGISVLLLGGVFSMGPYALQLSWTELTGLERFALLAYLAFMVGGKGYMGFHRGFSPRAAARAHAIAREPRPLRVLLAPLYGMSLIQAPVSRLLRSWGLMLVIAAIVPLVRALPQPWRGIVDAGVVAGLSVGLLSFWWFALIRPLLHPAEPT
jgi:hypothetical protein